MERVALSPRNNELPHREKATRLRKIITVDGIQNRVTEVIPAVPVHLTPLLHIPGWGMGEEGYTSFTENMAQRGYSSLFVIGLHKRRGFTPEGFSNIHIQKAHNIADTLTGEKIPEINILAHSEGALVASLMALHSLHDGPKVKNLVLVAPAGLIGKAFGVKLGLRFALHGLNIMKEDRAFLSSPEGQHTVREGTRRTLRHPLIALREIGAIAGSNAEDILKYVQEQGINVAIIQGDRDPVFPLKKIEQHAENAGLSKIYIVPHAKHSALYRDPHFPDYVDFVLSDLEKSNK